MQDLYTALHILKGLAFGWAVFLLILIYTKPKNKMSIREFARIQQGQEN